MTESSHLDEQKRTLRESLRAQLASLTNDERQLASSQACERLAELDVFRHAGTVMLYMPLATEVDTTPLAILSFQMGKVVCVPKVDWDRRDMRAVEVNSIDDHVMETDEHGLRSPRDGRPIVPASIDLVVVPALAFDTDGRRLGRGGGFYDRFLTRLRRSATACGFAYDLQVVELVPSGEQDVRVDLVVTDRRVTRARRSRSHH